MERSQEVSGSLDLLFENVCHRQFSNQGRRLPSGLMPLQNRR